MLGIHKFTLKKPKTVLDFSTTLLNNINTL